MSKWKPIETAPNDETILVYRSNGEYQLVKAEDNDYTWQPFVVDGMDRPTHWMWPPQPPSSRGVNVAKCEHPNCEREDAVRYRQNTKFVDEERNWVTLCPLHEEENDEYWTDMWSQYYQGCL
jgi:hypothetical protein